MRRFAPQCMAFFATAIIALSQACMSFDERAPWAAAHDVKAPPRSEDAAYREFSGASAGQPRDDNRLAMKFVWCPPGSFVMGAIQTVNGKQVNENQEAEELHHRLDQLDAQRAAGVALEKEDDEETDTVLLFNRKPRRETKVFLLHGYWLGKYEVTRAEFRRVMEKAPWENPRVVTPGDDYPATYVSWNDGTEFCRRFTEQERKAGRLPRGWEYRLPTEAQWERACRARATTRYSFGDDEKLLDDYGWHAGNTRKEPYPHRVGLKKPNAWGLHDMHGNVLEWCRDWYGNLPGGLGPEITEEGPQKKVQRGGCWGIPAPACRSGARFMEPPELKKLDFGFRVACSFAPARRS